MRIVYSYITYRFDSVRLMPLEVALTAYLSVLQARKYYNDVVLYTNEAIKKQVEEIGIPFTEINTSVLRDELASCPSIPKLKTYAAQTEPFIHIDLDTIFFAPLLHSKTHPAVFAHLDMRPGIDGPFEQYETLHKAYFLPFYDNVLPKYYSKISLADIPNMNIVVVNDVEFFKQNVQKSLALYESNKEYFDADYYRFCTIEQLSIFAEMCNDSKNFRQIVQDKEHVLHRRETVLIHREEFPLEIELKNFNNRKIKLGRVQDIRRLLDETFGGYLHLCGNLKVHPVVQAFIMYLLLKEFKGKPLTDLENYFGPLSSLQGSKYFKELSYQALPR